MLKYQSKLLVEALSKTGKFDIYYLTRKANLNYHSIGYKIIVIGNKEKLNRYNIISISRKIYCH